MRPKVIISGGQSGVDRAALDFALEKGLETGGWIPKGRIAEDGVIDRKYPNLTETGSERYSERTELNIIDSDATLIISNGELKGGSKLTRELTEKHKKPSFHLNFANTEGTQERLEILHWLSSIPCERLNIAGPRASEDKEIYQRTRDLLRLLFD
ncbi:MAG: hypothetical protein HKN25_17385 [Pyrinomonadaceae bacterium]|nr:hypothetical protein [Pyrinomonadaceae bacterium]